MKRALICLEQLGIGGVETFALTQIDEFNRRGIKCYVLCRDGILRKHIDNKKNIEWVEFDFKLEQTINSLKTKFGKNSIIKAMNLDEGATTIKRNKLIGGHNAETEDAD